MTRRAGFDIVVTVAPGSAFATVLFFQDVALAEDLAAFLLLTGSQYAVTWTAARSRRFRGWIKAEPRPLLRDGVLIPETLRADRITRDKVEAAIRAAGHAGPDRIALVMLETDGSLSVVPRTGA